MSGFGVEFGGAQQAYRVACDLSFFFQAEDGIRDGRVTGVQTCALPIWTICVLGAFTRSPPFPALFVLVKELRIVGSLVYGRAGARADFDIVLDILRRQGRRIAETLVTHRFPLADIGRAFATAADKTTGSIKVTIEA